MSKRVLDINDLNVGFSSYGETTKIVTDVSFHIDEGETVGIVGESGCGKSMTALSVMRLIKCPPGYIKGEIRLNGKNLLELSERQMCDVRGKDVSMIFQEPMTSLNPVITIGKQLMEVFRSHEKMTREEAWKKSVEALELVKIASPEQRMKEYPHQLSGGMRQRVMIAMALSCRPRLLIADEPTTALDVTIQAQILKLMRNLKETLDTSVKDYEPHLALDGGEDGLDFYRSISEKWKEALAPGGRLYFEVGIGQADNVLRIMRTQGFGDIQVVKDHHDIPRVVFGTLCTEL